MAFNPCAFCSAECCKNYVITVTSFDILRISERSKLQPKEFARIVPCTIFNASPNTVLYMSDGEENYGYLLTIKSHPCFFLDSKNRCIIHDYAPLCCRKYPFDLSGKMVYALYCPFYSKFLFRMQGATKLKEDYPAELTAYEKLVRKWNKVPGKLEDCLDWMMKKTKEKV